MPAEKLFRRDVAPIETIPLARRTSDGCIVAMVDPLATPPAALLRVERLATIPAATQAAEEVDPGVLLELQLVGH